MTNPTVATNRERIVKVEDDVTALSIRLRSLEDKHHEHIAKVELIIQMGKVILALVAASLGLDLGIGIQGGMV